MRSVPILAALLLTCCATPSPIDVRVECPPLRTWAAADLSALADAMAPLSESSPIWIMEKDWQRDRDAIRACINSPKP